MEFEKYRPSKAVYFVGSGKGGVGKSSVTVNLAVALAQQGLEVGVLDADVYGPSVPIMVGLRKISPRIQDCGEGREQVVPFTKFGIKVISPGFFMEEARSVVWRGPMLHGTLKKMIADVSWGQLDLLLIDLPPGTGDVPISLCQLLSVDGALVVTTPQEVAVLDAVKAINSFHQLNVPLVGIIENMAGFQVPETGQTHFIFGEGKAEELACRFETDFLGRVPLLPSIRQGSDEGRPAALHTGENQAGQYFYKIAETFRNVISRECLTGV